MHSFVEVWRPMKFKCFCGKGERRFRWTELRHADECVVSQGFYPVSGMPICVIAGVRVN